MAHENELNEEAEQLNEQSNAENSDVAAEPTSEDKLSELNDKYLRLHAEFDNFRRRTNKEKLEIISSANAGVLKDILPILDDFERAITNNEKVHDIDAVKEGFKLIHHKLKLSLESKGLKEMKTQDEHFDSELHEAIANVPAEKKKHSGKVVDTLEKGYYLNDKVIRYAKVVVAQ